MNEDPLFAECDACGWVHEEPIAKIRVLQVNPNDTVYIPCEKCKYPVEIWYKQMSRKLRIKEKEK